VQAGDDAVRGWGTLLGDERCAQACVYCGDDASRVRKSLVSCLWWKTLCKLCNFRPEITVIVHRIFSTLLQLPQQRVVFQ